MTIQQSVTQVVPSLIPVAQYVRMSDDGQQYSIENQKAAIQEYASQHAFVVVKTYADPGKSGITLKDRAALRKLLQDVVSGNTGYKAILVYDVSRWGRFRNSDEGGHYEFLCKSSGVPLHYCAEQFINDGTALGAIQKALKRSMAAEFSRELSEKIFRGKRRLAELGYWVSGPPGYGYRRMMISADGTPKQTMKLGEHKSLTTDRVILVPGPAEEVECVRSMFSMVLEDRLGCTAIARALNEQGITDNGHPWDHQHVFDIVTDLKYAGWNVWNRGTERLRAKRVPLEPQYWVTKRGAFTPIVDQLTFDRAQIILPRHSDSLWSDAGILRKLRHLLASKGRLSETLILKTRGMPATTTIRKRFGSYRRIYELVGYHLEPQDLLKRDQCERSRRLRQKLVGRIRELFPQHIVVTRLPDRFRSILCVDNSVMVSVLLCRTKRRNKGKLHWLVDPNPAERECLTLFCKLNSRHDRICSYYLFPRMQFRSHRSYPHDPWLATGTRLRNLSDFYEAVKTLSTMTTRSKSFYHY